MNLQVKNTLKSNQYYTFKHPLNIEGQNKVKKRIKSLCEPIQASTVHY